MKPQDAARAALYQGWGWEDGAVKYKVNGPKAREKLRRAYFNLARARDQQNVDQSAGDRIRNAYAKRRPANIRVVSDIVGGMG
jgi:hypothetical protein